MQNKYKKSGCGKYIEYISEVFPCITNGCLFIFFLSDLQSEFLDTLNREVKKYSQLIQSINLKK